MIKIYNSQESLHKRLFRIDSEEKNVFEDVDQLPYLRRRSFKQTK